MQSQSKHPFEARYLVAVGAVYLDTVLTVPHYPGEDEKLRAESLVRRRGGNCPNSLEVLTQFFRRSGDEPSRLALIAALPSKKSAAYNTIVKSLPGVNFHHAIIREDAEEAPSSYIIKSEVTGSRTIVNYNELSEMTVQEFKHSFESLSAEYCARLGLQPNDWWCHFEGRISEVTLQCIQFLRSAYPGVKISVEVEKPSREGLEDLAASADVVFYSKSWALSQGYKSAEVCLRQQALLVKSASHLFCTWGGDGAAALDIDTKEIIVLPAHMPAGSKVVDTIGAGDTFIAAILCNLLQSDDRFWSLGDTLWFAIELAGLKVAQEGFCGLREAMVHEEKP